LNSSKPTSASPPTPLWTGIRFGSQYRRQTKNYKTADIGARGRRRAREKKKDRYWVGEQPKQRQGKGKKVDTLNRGSVGCKETTGGNRHEKGVGGNVYLGRGYDVQP